MYKAKYSKKVLIYLLKINMEIKTSVFVHFILLQIIVYNSHSKIMILILLCWPMKNHVGQK